jgi:hypothetical protein
MTVAAVPVPLTMVSSGTPRVPAGSRSLSSVPLAPVDATICKQVVMLDPTLYVIGSADSRTRLMLLSTSKRATLKSCVGENWRGLSSRSSAS